MSTGCASTSVAPTPASVLRKSSSGAGLSELEALRGRFDKARTLMGSDSDANDVGSGVRMHDRASSALFKLLLHKSKPPAVLSPPRFAHIPGPTFAVAETYPLNPRPRFAKEAQKAVDQPDESVEERRAGLLALADDAERLKELSTDAETALLAFITSETQRTTLHVTNSPPRRKPWPADAASDRSASKPTSVKPAPTPLSPRKPSTAKRSPSRSSSPSQRGGKKPRTSTGSADENAPGAAITPIEL